MDERIRRGDIRLFSFSRPDKRRPVLVLTRPEVIELLHTVMVAPVTSVIRGAPSEVIVGVDEGLKKDSAVNPAARGKSPAAFKRRCIPVDLRCSSVKYVQYAPSLRLVSRAPHRSRCYAGFHHGLPDHVQTVEKARLKNFVGTVGPEKMNDVCRALAVAVACGGG